MRIETVAMIFTSVALSSGSQIILKRAMTAHGIQRTIEGGNILEIATMISISPLVITGLACFGLSAVVWVLVLCRTPLSSAYPFVALGILVTVLAGGAFFGEPITPQKALGVGLVMGGVLLVGIAG
jgi:multidrug transporter EmrE-like cation transporter